MKAITHTSLLLSLATSTLCLPAHAGNPETDVWPKPQKSEVQAPVGMAAEQLAPQAVKPFPALVEAFNTRKLKPSGTTPITTIGGEAAKTQLKAAHIKPIAGAYLLTISPKKITITAADQAGIFYATQTLAQMITADGKLPSCRIADWPDMPFRGSIEGFYGKPWEHERRLSQIRFYGKYKMNAYIYGPKDDPYSGFNSNLWREPYPAEQAKQISELVKTSRENHVNFIWALHPGSSIRWDDKNGDGTPDDIITAQKKLEAMYQLGVRSFAVFFDDIGGEGAKAEMQAKMLNQINRDFIKKKKDVTPLLMCPTDYAGAHGSDYKKSLGAALDKDIDIMWTGPRICADIPADSVESVSEHWQRKPFIWWNWPVNDYCRYNLLLGRTYGLDKGNKGQLSGFASNPMDKPEASKIALFSIANWAWNIDAFDSQASWKASFPRLYGDLAKPMFVFSQHNSDQGPSVHGYRREESVTIKPTVDKALEQYRSSKQLGKTEAQTLSKEFASITEAAQTIIRNMPTSDPALWHEIEFWVKSFEELGKAGTAAVTLASGNGGNGPSHMALFSTIATAKARQQAFSDAQKQRHFEETFPSDKKWSKGCKVATLVLSPLVDELFTSEWAKAYKLLGGKASSGSSIYRAFSNVDSLNKIQAERDGKYVSLQRILEVVKLAPKKHIGLALPEGVHANYIHIVLNDAKAAETCIIEVSKDGKKWTTFNARKSNGELQNPVNPNEQIRYFRMLNPSSTTLEFRIEKFKFDVPADAKSNSISAATDGDPTSYYTINKAETFTGPAKAKQAYILTDAPETAIKRNGNQVTITPPKEGKLHLFEILWR
ncbi:beta-N-acetylglucosaminidase domain-containing protein [Verrucomicrobiaceae bacterium N1E253]|uniref:Beta-N-acetylglucosaminidase domain-containing protein n=1 Tax=Oceaniferula marina TaxID=2748318 RepID=A0A851GCH8_9BACT|nr:beta-N-acetylglucosaminidase domain-containing protein [Oceaniferula marina]NWK55438.1 beta-N-acetylglucosaminidase domain-containing protein [Oceaniferula marina]